MTRRSHRSTATWSDGAIRRPDAPRIDAPWLIGVARHKLADHWRRRARDGRRLQLAGADCAELLGRSLHATEALLVRARVAFRRACTEEGPSR